MNCDRAIPEIVFPLVSEAIKAPSPWDREISRLVSYPILVQVAATPQEQFRLESSAYLVQTGLHWMIKQTWDSTHKIPADPKMRRGSKALGAWFRCIRELCLEAHEFDLRSHSGSKYTHPTEWFEAIVKQLLYIGVWRSMHCLYFSNDPGIECPSLRNIQLSLNAVCSRVKAFERIQDDSPLADLLNISMQMAERWDIFRKQKYVPFIKTWREVNLEIEKYWNLVIQTPDSKLIVQNGRGKGSTRLL